MGNRRRSPRLAVNQLAELRIEDNLRPIPCIVEDISAGGICVSLHRDLFPEVFSNVSFALANNFGFDAGATVAWQDNTEGRSTYGLRFNRIDDSSRAHIAQYVSKSPSEEEKNNWWKGLEK